METADLVAFTKEILNGKLHFFVSWGVRNFGNMIGAFKEVDSFFDFL